MHPIERMIRLGAAMQTEELSQDSFDEGRLLVYHQLHFDTFTSTFSSKYLTQGRSYAIKKIDLITTKSWQLTALIPSYKAKIKRELERLKRLPISSYRLSRIKLIAQKERLLVLSEMCSHGDLFHWLLTRGFTLPLIDVIEVFSHILNGLQFFHAHENTAFHLDPWRIAFRGVLPCTLVLLPDLSFTKLLDEAQHTLGRFSFFDHWSPEQVTTALGYNGHTDARDQTLQHAPSSDVWNFGVIAVMVMTGDRLFRTNTLKQLSASIKNSDLNAVCSCEALSPLPDDIIEEIRACLRPIAEDRSRVSELKLANNLINGWLPVYKKCIRSKVEQGWASLALEYDWCKQSRLEQYYPSIAW